MTEVREGVDAIDRALVALMARRFGYMEAAARIKPSRETVRDEQRKADVIANVKAHAAELGVPVPLAAALWEMLVESSIAYEFVRYDEMRG
ncbi:chorismate mutase [Parasphingopyxis algicola]|nr:chorismate mutase [Parasphingopyxis algicola]